MGNIRHVRVFIFMLHVHGRALVFRMGLVVVVRGGYFY
jgi:hypothetical protein